MRAIRHYPPSFTEPKPLTTIAASLALSLQYGLTVAGDAKPLLIDVHGLALLTIHLAACVARAGEVYLHRG